MTADFNPGPEWEQVTYDDLDDGGELIKVETADRSLMPTYWRRKPQEPTSPSPEAAKLSDDMSSAPTWDARLQVIDEALAAARQQGQEEGWNAGYAKCEQQGRDEVHDCPAVHREHELAKTLSTALDHKDEEVRDLRIQLTEALRLLIPESETGIQPDQIQVLPSPEGFVDDDDDDDDAYEKVGAIPDNKVLVDREVVEDAADRIDRGVFGVATVASLRAALEGEA